MRPLESPDIHAFGPVLQASKFSHVGNNAGRWHKYPVSNCIGENAEDSIAMALLNSPTYRQTYNGRSMAWAAPCFLASAVKN